MPALPGTWEAVVRPVVSRVAGNIPLSLCLIGSVWVVRSAGETVLDSGEWSLDGAGHRSRDGGLKCDSHEYATQYSCMR